MSDDLFATPENQVNTPTKEAYTAQDIEVLEGLEPVRRRPGMYIGGTDDNALHHLVAEVFDNSMDEAVAGHASRIELHVQPDNVIVVKDNGRGIPVDPHPKYPDKSALEVILTTLHAGGKFSSKAYETSGGLHGVGVSVVNALSDRLEVEVARNKQLYHQHFSKGIAQGGVEELGSIANRRGTNVTFHPDPEIFGKATFKPKRLYEFAKSKAYLYRGVEIRWQCDASLIKDGEVPENEVIHFPGGLKDFLSDDIGESPTVTPIFSGEAQLEANKGRVEWAIAWPVLLDARQSYFCNTVPTPLGGTHATGFRAALYKALRDFGERVNNKKAALITGEDVLDPSIAVLSLFYSDPQFQGQTKDKLMNQEVSKLTEQAVRDPFDIWLASNTEAANGLLDYAISRAEERKRRKAKKDTARKTITQKLRLPGKLADCSNEEQEGTELFLVEGDSAGGSAKQARNRATQAILPLRGKILNVASATKEKIHANQEIKDMLQALGVGTRKDFKVDDLRYEKVIIMTDADVDGAHIASLLMTFFYQEMPELITKGHLYLANPPLYRITQGAKSYYAADEAELNDILEKLPKNKGKIDTGRFKGLGEMTPQQLKETTMQPDTRTLLRVEIATDGFFDAQQKVKQLMSRDPEPRFRFITEQSALRQDVIAQLDV